MSWQIAVAVGSIASAGAQYIAASSQAKAGAKTARIQQETHLRNAELIELQSRQSEVNRFFEYEVQMAKNWNDINYDPLSSKSFEAIEKNSKDNLQRDLGNISLMGNINKQNELASAKMQGIAKEKYAQMGRFAWLQPAGTILQGGYKAYQVGTPTKTKGVT